jgi:repressor LexA
LTPKQLQLLEAIKKFISVHDYPPSFEEMALMIDSHSKGHIYALLTGLEERGYIRRLKNRSRAIEIVPDPTLPVEVPYALAHLVAEVRRRGLVVGRFVQEIHHAQGESPVVKRRFKEVTEEEING